MPVVESTIHINRMPRDVFAFISDYERDPTWRSEVISMTHQNPGPIGKGRLVLSFAPSSPDAAVQKDV